jgi:hypothetical protein
VGGGELGERGGEEEECKEEEIFSSSHRERQEFNQ